MGGEWGLGRGRQGRQSHCIAQGAAPHAVPPTVHLRAAPGPSFIFSSSSSKTALEGETPGAAAFLVFLPVPSRPVPPLSHLLPPLGGGEGRGVVGGKEERGRVTARWSGQPSVKDDFLVARSDRRELRGSQRAFLGGGSKNGEC